MGPSFELEIGADAVVYLEVVFTRSENEHITWLLSGAPPIKFNRIPNCTWNLDLLGLSIIHLRVWMCGFPDPRTGDVEAFGKFFFNHQWCLREPADQSVKFWQTRLSYNSFI
jgi:hypothetical protein